jgi:hypothetical protein
MDTPPRDSPVYEQPAQQIDVHTPILGSTGWQVPTLPGGEQGSVPVRWANNVFAKQAELINTYMALCVSANQDRARVVVELQVAQRRIAELEARQHFCVCCGVGIFKPTKQQESPRDLHNLIGTLNL